MLYVIRSPQYTLQVPVPDKEQDRQFAYNTTSRRVRLTISGVEVNIQVSQEERTKLREGVYYVKLYRYNPKHLYPNLNGYGDIGKRNLKLWQLLHTYWLPNSYWNWQEYVVSVMLISVLNIKVTCEWRKAIKQTSKTSRTRVTQLTTHF